MVIQANPRARMRNGLNSFSQRKIGISVMVNVTVRINIKYNNGVKTSYVSPSSIPGMKTATILIDGLMDEIINLTFLLLLTEPCRQSQPGFEKQFPFLPQSIRCAGECHFSPCQNNNLVGGI